MTEPQAEMVAMDALMDVASDGKNEPVLRIKAAARLLDHIDYAAERVLEQLTADDE